MTTDQELDEEQFNEFYNRARTTNIEIGDRRSFGKKLKSSQSRSIFKFPTLAEGETSCEIDGTETMGSIQGGGGEEATRAGSGGDTRTRLQASYTFEIVQFKALRGYFTNEFQGCLAIKNTKNYHTMRCDIYMRDIYAFRCFKHFDTTLQTNTNTTKINWR